MFGGRTFHFRPVLTVLSLVAFGVLISLGMWQLRRLEWKTALIAQVDARVDAAPIPFEEAVRRAEVGENMGYTPVTLAGAARPGAEEKVFGSYEGAAGVYVFTPVKSPSGADVYVNQGFLPQGAAMSGAGDGEPISGLFRYAEKPSPPASWFQPKGKSADGLWFIRDPKAFAGEEGIETVPYYIDRFAVEGREWPKGGVTRLDFRNSHLDYALTWFGLAAVLAGVFIAASLQRAGS